MALEQVGRVVQYLGEAVPLTHSPSRRGQPGRFRPVRPVVLADVVQRPPIRFARTSVHPHLGGESCDCVYF